MKAFTGLSRPSLLALAKALQGGRLSAPYSSSEVGRYIAERERATIAEVLQRLDDGAMRPEQIAMVLELLADERLRAQVMADRLDLVWSGPNGSRGQTRATATVVRELFAAARRSVLVASYALDRGERAQAIFAGLAERMDSEPELEVRLFVNVARPYGDETPESVLLREFADAFRDELWPGDRLPIVFHDPRALALGFDERACLHAKCVVIDDERALVTSANFTEAAQARNIEVGVLVDEPGVAAGLRRQFEALVAAGVLVRVAGLEERR
jgi:phosphatidylserine/phosphatidylglycerophosphate/cardiolipin synthase-like enzyme